MTDPIRDFALTLDDATQRAARDGYDIRPMVLAHIIEQLGDPWRVITQKHQLDVGAVLLEPRTSPSPEAVAALERITYRAKAMALPPGIDILAGEISRATVKVEGGNISEPTRRDGRGILRTVRTVIPVLIKTTWSGDVLALFDAEGA